MIQRIQTLYLLLVVVLSCIMLFSPMVDLYDKSGALVYRLTRQGVFQTGDTENTLKLTTWCLTVISAIVPLVALATILLFKKRLIQIRLSIFNIVLMFGFYALLFIYIWLAKQQLATDWYLRIVCAFPLVNVILTVLAVRAIGKDEALVKSLNRLR
ncbi:MAG: DUF4293 domain-containing protein [Prevotellaceae bacterium]|jgi:hypothetical protein|nr:DUF4293 domain-containing protein [Prevotellaceae bacterium]